MATIGQVTASGGRSFPIHPQQMVLREITLATDFTLNHVGIWCWEQVAANDNNLKGAIYTLAGALIHETAIRTAPISSLSTPQSTTALFSGQTVSAGTYLIAMTAGNGASGYILCNGQNGAGGTPVSANVDPATSYPDFPASLVGLMDSAAARAWDIWLDYTVASSSPKPSGRSLNGGFVDMNGGF